LQRHEVRPLLLSAQQRRLTLAVLRKLLGLGWLGPGPFERGPMRRCWRRPRTLRLGRCFQHIIVRGPARGHGRCPHGAVPSRRCVCRRLCPTSGRPPTKRLMS